MSMFEYSAPIPRIDLWSYQGTGFSLFDGSVNYCLSPNRDNPYILAAYRRLWQRFGTNQFVWCYTQRRPKKADEVEWILQVPRSSILAFMNNVVWNRIIKAGNFAPPQTLSHQWKYQAIESHPDNLAKQHDFIARKHKEFWDEQPPKGGWWNKLLIPEGKGEQIDALLRHPVNPCFQVDKCAIIHQR